MEECSPVLLEQNIPYALATRSQWVCWRYVDRGGGRKPDKQPVNPHNLHNAGATWPNTWADFKTAFKVYRANKDGLLHGIGFVLTVNDPFVAIDMDNCVEEFNIHEHATKVIVQLESYTEISPSGHGIRILVACPEFQQNLRRGPIEIYSHDRYVTITGNHLPGIPTEIMPVSTAKIQSLIPSEPEPQPAQSILPIEPKYKTTDQNELWQRIFRHDRYGADHEKRFNGDTSLDGNDHSMTVIRLLNCLARWTHGDRDQVRSLILMSPLQNPKWFEKRGKQDWLDHQIDDAIGFISRQRH